MRVSNGTVGAEASFVRTIAANCPIFRSREQTRVACAMNACGINPEHNPTLGPFLIEGVGPKVKKGTP